MTGDFVRRKDFGQRCRADTHRGRRPFEDRDRDWYDAFPNQEINSKDCWQGNHQKLEKRTGADCLSESPEGTNPAHTLILDFRPPDCERINSVVLSHPVMVLCYGSPEKRDRHKAKN